MGCVAARTGRGALTGIQIEIDLAQKRISVFSVIDIKGIGAAVVVLAHLFAFIFGHGITSIGHGRHGLLKKSSGRYVIIIEIVGIGTDPSGRFLRHCSDNSRIASAVGIKKLSQLEVEFDGTVRAVALDVGIIVVVEVHPPQNHRPRVRTDGEFDGIRLLRGQGVALEVVVPRIGTG